MRHLLCTIANAVAVVGAPLLAIPAEQARAQSVELVQTCCGVSGFNSILPTDWSDSALAEPFLTDHAYYKLSSAELVAVANWMSLRSDSSGKPGTPLGQTTSMLSASTHDSVKFSLGGVPTLRPDGTYWLAFGYRQTDGTTFGAASSVTISDVSGHGAGFVPKYAITNNLSAGAGAAWDVIEPMPRNVIPTTLTAERLGIDPSAPVPFDACDLFVAIWKCSFVQPASGFWFAAQPKSVQDVALSSGSFLAITAPGPAAGFASYDLSVGGVTVGSVAAGASFSFADHGLVDIADLTISGRASGLAPEPAFVQASASGSSLGFLLDFEGSPESLSFMTEAAPVPEPTTWVLLLLGSAALCQTVRATNRRQAA